MCAPELGSSFPVVVVREQMVGDEGVLVFCSG